MSSHNIHFSIDKDSRQRCHLAKGSNGWERVTFEGYLYQTEDANIIPDDRTLCPIPLYIIQKKQIRENIECPSIVFVIITEKIGYDIIKLLSHFKFGVVTQCIVASKYQGQSEKSKDPYCANVAMKVNGKLSNMSNEARVWSTSHNGAEGISWLREAPTFVMGLSMSNTLGQSPVSIISGTTGLDSCCIRMGQDVR